MTGDLVPPGDPSWGVRLGQRPLDNVVQGRYPSILGAPFRIFRRWRRVSNMPTDPMQVRYGCNYGSHWESYDAVQVGAVSNGVILWMDLPVDEAPIPQEPMEDRSFMTDAEHKKLSEFILSKITPQPSKKDEL